MLSVSGPCSGRSKPNFQSLTTEEAKVATLEVVRDVLSGEEVIVGEFREEGGETSSFVPWQTSVTDAVRRIGAEWGVLGRDPSLGEIAWFVAPRLLPFAMNRDPMANGRRP
ncbi:MAG: uncharacterized protein JWP97_6267 [Labilithrix sp.]|nr:uncharacterized protein [Labilithrix sp.]